jgi:hydrogenase-4 component B
VDRRLIPRGAVAICGLPPLNGFVSDVRHLGLFRASSSPARDRAAVFGIQSGVVGALAVACFVSVRTAFLGEPAPTPPRGPAKPRGNVSAHARARGLLRDVGLAPMLVVRSRHRIACWSRAQPAKAWAPRPAGRDRNPRRFAVALRRCFVFFARRCDVSRRGPTWDCGYAHPTPRMQYTATSFAQTIVLLFGSVLNPRTHRPRVNGLFPLATRSQSHVDDAVLDRFLIPAAERIREHLNWFHRFQRGSPNTTCSTSSSHFCSCWDFCFRSRQSLNTDSHDNPRSSMISILFHLTVLLLLPPLLPGVITKTKAWFAGRTGPSVFQPYYDISKLMQRGWC